MKAIYFAAAAASVAAVLLLAGPAAAARQQLHANPPCGSTIGTNVTLTGNMTCSSSDGLDIGANGITVNLNGYTLTVTNDSYYGIYNDGYNNVTVENGTIELSDGSGTTTNYGDEGIYSYEGSSNTYTGLTIENAYDAGIYLDYETSDVVTNNTLRYNNGEGVYTEYGADNNISGNVLHDNPGDYGVETYSDAQDTISSNYSQFNYYNFYDESSDQNTYYGNITNGGTYGIYIDGGDYGSVNVVDNGFRNSSSDGVYSDSAYASGDGGQGYSAEAPYSMFNGNTAIYSGSYGYYSEYDNFSTWTNNVATRNGSYGFYFYYPWRYTITNNTSNYNGDTGFYVSENYYGYQVQTFSNNTAMYNTDYGFYGDYGVPGSGNTGGNTNSPADCFLVAGCS